MSPDRSEKRAAGCVAATPDVSRSRRLELGKECRPLERLGPENRRVGLRQRALVRRGEHVTVEDPRCGVVDQRRLRRPLEQRLGLVHEELVEPVLARDEHGEPRLPTAGTSPLLAERRNGAREAHGDRAVERADVDAELQRVRRGHPEQLALDEPPLDLPPLLGRVPRAVRREPACGRAVETVAREAVDELRRLPALREADRLPSLADEAGQEPGCVRERAGTRAELLVEQLGVPEHDLPVGPRRRVDVDDPDVEPGQARGEVAGVRDRRRREDEHGLGAVGERESAQPAKDVRDVRPEDAAVHVGLVDHDDPQVVERVSPAVVVREDADVEHVRVREDRVRAPADVSPPLDRRVAVVDRRAETAQAEGREPARLVLRERLRRIEVEHPRRRLARDRVERRQREREGLPRRRPGRDDDVLAAGHRLPRLGLVRVEAGDAPALERLRERGVQRVRQRLGPPRAAGLDAAMDDLRAREQLLRHGYAPSTRATASA